MCSLSVTVTVIVMMIVVFTISPWELGLLQ